MDWRFERLIRKDTSEDARTIGVIKGGFIVSVALVMLASILDPLDPINFVFIASLFVASAVAWLLHRLMSK